MAGKGRGREGREGKGKVGEGEGRGGGREGGGGGKEGGGGAWGTEERKGR